MVFALYIGMSLLVLGLMAFLAFMLLRGAEVTP